ncbi:hypothetical protein U1Q18_035690 [Sarracenia purpurea var. burkii]
MARSERGATVISEWVWGSNTIEGSESNLTGPPGQRWVGVTEHLSVRILRSGRLDRRSTFGGDRQPVWDYRPSLRNALAELAYGAMAQACAISSHPRMVCARRTSRLKEGGPRCRDLGSGASFSLSLSPRDGAGDIGFWPLICRYLVYDPPSSMSSSPLGSFAISDPGKVDLCFKPGFVLSYSFLRLLDLVKTFLSSFFLSAKPVTESAIGGA